MNLRQASHLSSRLFGLWTLIAGLNRIACAIFIRNKILYWITFSTFCMAFIHFLSEIFIYNSTNLGNKNVIPPLIIAGISMLLMIGGYFFI
ncbi:unnamed protein product [Gordionus sp. m RMFG-2023]